jgi:hypothetical protein
VGQQQVREPGVLGEQQGLVALGQHLLEDLLQADHLARPATHEEPSCRNWGSAR